MSNSIKEAINAFSNGLPVCLFDSEKREGETDLLFSAQHVTPENMRQLRQDCGGLLFLAIGHEVGEKFGLPFLQDLHTHEALTSQYDVLQELVTNDLRYDSRSAFTLSLNHRGTYTGITDKDRCLTTRRFAELTNEVFTNNTEDKEVINKKIHNSYEKIIRAINENSNIQIIIKNKNDEDISTLLDELLQDHKEQSNLRKIESLEQKLINNLDENSYSELIKLKSQLNRE